MSRIGKTPIVLKEGVTFEQKDDTVVVTGPKGSLRLNVPKHLHLEKEQNSIKITTKKHTKDAQAMYGNIRAQLNNFIEGVSVGFSKSLELSGVGYRASMSGSNLVLTVGFSHPVTIVPPEGIVFSTTEGKITVSGIDKQLVGQVAADIRAVKKPEPYKGKGIKYEGEHIRKKAGKSAKTVGATAGVTK